MHCAALMHLLVASLCLSAQCGALKVKSFRLFYSPEVFFYKFSADLRCDLTRSSAYLLSPYKSKYRIADPLVVVTAQCQFSYVIISQSILVYSNHQIASKFHSVRSYLEIRVGLHITGQHSSVEMSIFDESNVWKPGALCTLMGAHWHQVGKE